MIWVTAVSLIRLIRLPLLMVMEDGVKLVCPMCTSVLLPPPAFPPPPPALPPQATTHTVTTTRTTTAARTFFMAYSSPLEQGLVLCQASPRSLGRSLPTSSALLDRQRPHHVALGRHGAFKAARTRAAGVEALEGVGACFAGVEGEADGIGLLAIAGKGHIDVQLHDREGVRDLVGGQGGIGLPVAIGRPTDGSLYGGKGRIFGQSRVQPKVIIVQGDRHQAIGRHDQVVGRKGRPILLIARLIDDDIEFGLDMPLRLGGGSRFGCRLAATSR